MCANMPGLAQSPLKHVGNTINLFSDGILLNKISTASLVKQTIHLVVHVVLEVKPSAFLHMRQML